MAKLSDFMISRVRVKLLKTFLENPTEMHYVRQLTRHTKEEINAVRRELSHMQQAGMIKSEKRGNRLYYQFRSAYRFYPELLSMVAKTTSIGKVLIKNKAKLGFIKFAFISTRLIKGGKRQLEDIDLMLVGKVIMPQIALLVKAFEEKKNIEVNYSCMTEEEFLYRQSHRDPFILNILTKPRIMLIGNEELLVK